MRRGLRGLVIVLGMLWVAAAADALTMWNGADASLELRSFLFEDYGGAVVGNPGDPGVSYWRRPSGYPLLGLGPSFGRRSFVPYSYSRLAPPPWPRAGGNPRFGRRDFIWHPGPVVPPGYYIPVGRLPGFRDDYLYNGPGPSELSGHGRSNRLPRRKPSGRSWQSVRDLVGVLPYPNFPLFTPIDRWDSTIIMLPGLELLRNDYAGEAIELFPGLEQGSSFGGRLEFRSDRFSFSVEDFYGASASAVGNAAPIPEPGTAALLLAGLCALAARGRRC